MSAHHGSACCVSFGFCADKTCAPNITSKLSQEFQALQKPDVPGQPLAKQGRQLQTKLALQGLLANPYAANGGRAIR